MSVEKRSNIKISNLITGTLKLDKDSTLKIDRVDIFLDGIKEPLAEVAIQQFEGGVNFEYLIESKARVGNYSVAWVGSVSGKETKVFDEFIISDDNIDRTLPLELQHLK